MQVKQILPYVLIVLFFFVFSGGVHAQEEESDESLEQLVEEQLGILKIDEIQAYWEKISDDYGGFFYLKVKRGA